MDEIITNAAPSTGGEPGTNALDGAVNGTGTQPETAAEKKFSQAEVNRMMAEDRRKTKAAADEAQRIKAGEFEALATERKTRLDETEAELERLKQQNAAYETRLETDLKARIKALPEEMRDLVAGETLDARAASLDKVEAAAKKLIAQRTPGTPSGPRGNGGSTGNTMEKLIADKRQSGDYGPM